MLKKRGEIWHVKFKAGGQVIQRSAGTTSKRKAQEFERELRNEVARQLHAGRTGLPVAYLYRDALLRWIEEGAPQSMMSHARNTRPYLDDVPLHLIVPAASVMRAKMLKRKLSPQTINRRLAVVRRILNVAYRQWDWISEPLGMKIDLLSEKGYEREVYLTRAEVDALLSHVENETAKKVILIAAYTGLRKSEILKLQASNWKPPYLVLSNDTKSKKARSLPVVEVLHPLMTPPFEISPYELRKAFEGARDAMQRPDIRFHDLRHTFASWLAKDPSIPLTVIRDTLGHSSILVTNKYIHLRNQNFELINEALKKH